MVCVVQVSLRENSAGDAKKPRKEGEARGQGVVGWGIKKGEWVGLAGSLSGRKKFGGTRDGDQEV